MNTSYVFQIALKKLYIIFKYGINNSFKFTHVLNMCSSEILVTEYINQQKIMEA